MEFGVPLNAGYPVRLVAGAALVAYGFDHPVLRAARFDHEARRQRFDALVVDAVGGGLLHARVQRRQVCAGHELDRVAEVFIARQFDVQPRCRLQVANFLQQAAAESDVDELEAAADAEHRRPRA